MTGNRDMFFDEEGITKLIKKIFEDEFKKQEQNHYARNQKFKKRNE